MMDSDQSFETILTSFGITHRATKRLTEDYVTENDLMASNVEQIESVFNLQNKMYRSHATALHCCYIKRQYTIQLCRINVTAMERSSVAPVHLVLDINDIFDLFNV